MEQLKLQQKTPTATVSAEMLEVFDAYLQHTSSKKAAEVAQSIAAAVKVIADPQSKKQNGEEDDDDDVESFLWKTWGDIFGIVEQIPHDHPAQDKVVKVLRELTLLPDTGLRVWQQRVFTDLPILGACWRERLNGPKMSKDDDEQASICKAWVNFNAFAARLDAAGLWENDNHAIWMLRTALEEDLAAKPPRMRDCHVMTAAVIVEHNGPLMAVKLRSADQKQLSEAEGRMYKAGSLFTDGKPGLHAGRWAFWMRRFREEAGKTADDDVRRAALRAATLMEIWDDRRKSLLENNDS